jgi:hypothetical protein
MIRKMCSLPKPPILISQNPPKKNHILICRFLLSLLCEIAAPYLRPQIAFLPRKFSAILNRLNLFRHLTFIKDRSKVIPDRFVVAGFLKKKLPVTGI